MGAGFFDLLGLTGIFPLAGLAIGTGSPLPKNFSVTRAFEGPQILIAWDAPDATFETDHVVLVRKLYGYPRDKDDGDVIYSGAPVAKKISDRSLNPGVYYYYKLFVVLDSTEVVTSKLLQGASLPVESGFFAAKLWSLLDQVYHLADQRLSEGRQDQAALSLEQDPETGAYYNLDEDGQTEKGPLQRFLKIFGTELDTIRGLIAAIPDQRDVDHAFLEFLPAMASIIGATVNQDLDASRQREDVKRTVAGYKVRGTAKGLVAKIRSLSGLTAVVDPDYEHILCSNTPGRTSPDVTPIEGANMGLPTELLYYSSDDELFSWLTFGIFVSLPSTKGLDAATVQKLCETVPDFTPICRTGRLRILVDPIREALTDFAGDALSGGLAAVRDPIPPFGDSITYTKTLSPPSFWLVTNLRNSGDITNNPVRFTPVNS